MSLGTYGSTLLSELNRLANGGTYPPVNTMDQAAAARAWAASQDVLLTVNDTVGVLNEIAGLPREDWLDYSGVCNYLAGTTGLPAAAALRQITGVTPFVPYPSGDGTCPTGGIYDPATSMCVLSYPATATQVQVPGAWVRDFGCSNPNWWAWYGAAWMASHPDQMLDPAGCVNGGINVYMIDYQTTYSCPTGTYDPGTGMCIA